MVFHYPHFCIHFPKPSQFSFRKIPKKKDEHSALELGAEELTNHQFASNVRRLPEGREVERARQAICEAKEEHGRDPAAGVLHGEAALGHLVLLDLAAAQVVHAAGRVHLGLVLAGHVGHLRAREDVEVVVGRVAAGMALGADSSACGLAS